MAALETRMNAPLVWKPVTNPGPTCQQFVPTPHPALDDNPFIPSGYTYLSQFVAHDMVATRVPFWATDSLAVGTSNERHVRLRLEALYGGGPTEQPLIYAPDGHDDHSRTRLQLGQTKKLKSGLCPYRDIGRLALTNTLPPLQGSPVSGLPEPLIADPRNDDHAIIAQLTMLLHLMHNTFVSLQQVVPEDDSVPDFTQATNERFSLARRATTLVYRRIVRDDLMRRVLHPAVYSLYNENPRDALLDPESSEAGSALPLEFSHGAYRFGHSMTRDKYIINADTDPASDDTTLQNALSATSSDSPFDMPLSETWLIRWSNFFHNAGTDPARINLSRRIGPFVPHALRGGGRLQPISSNARASQGVVYRDLISAGLAELWSVSPLIEAIRCASPAHRCIIDSSPLLASDTTWKDAIREWLQQDNGYWPASPLTDKDSIVAALVEQPPLPFFVLFEAASEKVASGWVPGCRLGVLGSIIVAEVVFGEFHDETMMPEERTGGYLADQLNTIHAGFGNDWPPGTVEMKDVVSFIWQAYLSKNSTEAEVPLS